MKCKYWVILSILIAIVLLLAITATYMLVKKHPRKIKETLYIENYKDFLEPAIGHPGSCIDCEDQYIPEQKWRAQPSKCFSCERDMLRRHGEEAVFMATKQKCFDC